MSPMRGEVMSFTDSFAVRVFPSNPYEQRIKVLVRVYDQNFYPVDARVTPAEFMLAGKARVRCLSSCRSKVLPSVKCVSVLKASPFQTSRRR